MNEKNRWSVERIEVIVGIDASDSFDRSTRYTRPPGLVDGLPEGSPRRENALRPVQWDAGFQAIAGYCRIRLLCTRMSSNPFVSSLSCCTAVRIFTALCFA